MSSTVEDSNQHISHKSQNSDLFKWADLWDVSFKADIWEFHLGSYVDCEVATLTMWQPQQKQLRYSVEFTAALDKLHIQTRTSTPECTAPQASIFNFVVGHILCRKYFSQIAKFGENILEPQLNCCKWMTTRSSSPYLFPTATMSIIKNSYTVGGQPEKLYCSPTGCPEQQFSPWTWPWPVKS